MNSYCIVLLFVGLLSSSLAANCYGPASKLAITEFDAFPSPVDIGGTVYVRTVINPTYDMGSAMVQLSVYYSEKTDVTGLTPIIDITSLQLCNLSTSITCPIKNGTHILAWEYKVPNILPGTYQVQYTILEDSPADGNPYSCIQFSITVAGPQANSFTSWYQATLFGTALFQNPDYKARQTGEYLQVGPSGPLNGTMSPVPYGTISFLSGSGDLVPNAYYDTTNFVWGLSGIMQKQSVGANGQITHVYQGECYLGYINTAAMSILGNNYDYTTPLFEGTFTLTWTYTDSSTAQISGTATFTPPDATLPYGWGFPLLYGRLGTHQISMSDVGFLQIQASLPFCASGVCASPPPQGGSGKGLSSEKLGLAIGLPIAAVFIIILIAAALLYLKKRRETEQEDGIFAVSRKPEYGSALVVDGIIEETMGSKPMQAMLDMRDADDDDESEGESDDGGSDGMRSRSRSRSRSPAGHSRSRSNSRDVRSESDPGESADRDSDSD